MSDIRAFYENATAHLESHLNFFDDNPLKSIASLSLTRAITFDKLVDAVTLLGDLNLKRFSEGLDGPKKTQIFLFSSDFD